MPLLTEAILDQFLDAIRASGARLAEHLQPGVSDREIDELITAAGVSLPTEARTWWRWRNGVSASAKLALAGDFRWLPLDRAVDEYRELRRESVALAEQPWSAGPAADPDYFWAARFFPVITTSYGAITCDCSVPENAQSPMRMVHWEGGSTDGSNATSSFAELLDWWIDAIRTGGWVHDGRHYGLTRVHECLDPDRRAAGVV
jgi:hypothetical protein